MDEIKLVINELNQQPFNKNLNLIGYDNLRSEQRLDLLIEVLNVIDPRVSLFAISLRFLKKLCLICCACISWVFHQLELATSKKSCLPYSIHCEYSNTIHH